jgi:thiopeptide-type bacteriocin biosynthesis protein
MKSTFILGEKWLYYKIYCGTQSTDNILIDKIAPFSKHYLNNHLITQWFFIRYDDPDPHLRIRFKLKNKSDLGKLVTAFLKMIYPSFKNGIIWNITTDTYVRELERYGVKTMKPSEQIFNNNSELVIKMLNSVKEEELYFLIILRCVNSFLNQFQLEKDELFEFYKLNALAFTTEFDVQKVTRISIDKKYRNIRNRFEEIMHNEKFVGKYPSLNQIIFENATLNKDSIKMVRTLKVENLLDVDFVELLSSYIHMFFNRAFRTNQRFYEMLGYEFLRRYNLSVNKRNLI